MIKRILFFAIITCLSATQLMAQVIASENFDSYGAGTDIGGGNGGTGWLAPWEIITGDDKAVIADSIKNYRTGIATGTVLDVDFLTDGNDVRMDRQLAVPIIDDGNTYWLAFDAFYEGPGGANASVVAFANTDATEPTGPGGQLIIFGKVAQGDGQSFGVGLNNPNVQVDLPKAQGTHWVVAKVEFSGDAEEDVVYLFINPDPSVEPTNDMADQQFSSTALNDGFNGIFIKNEGPSGIRTLYDNLILGNNFSDVVPTGTNTVPLFRPVREAFNYNAGTNLEGQGTGDDGWGGPWEFINTPGPLNVVQDSIQNFNVLRSTRANALEMNLAGETRIKRDLAEPYEDNGLTYWFSFFGDISNSSNGNALNVGLANDNFVGSGPGGQLLLIGKMSSDESIGLGVPPSNFNTIPDVANQANWFVARIETNGTADADTVRLYLNPDPNVEPQVGEEVQKFAATTLNNGWTAIGAKATGNPTTLESIIDDIMLGLSYQEVIPDDLEIISNLRTPAFDNFDYAASTALTPADSVGAIQNGWAGPWKSRIGSTVIEADSIINPFNNRATTQNALAMDNNGELRLFRGLETDYEDNGLTYWFGFWMDIDFTGTGEVMQVILGDTAAFGTSGPGGQFLRTGLNFDSRNIRVFTSDGTHDTGVSADTAHWVVMKIQTSGNSNADSVKVFIDPSPDTEPGDDMANVEFTTTALNNGWNGIMIKTSGTVAESGGMTSVDGIVDNIYVGNAYVDIVPTDLVDVTPFFTAGPTYEPFNYETTNDLAGNGVRESGFAGPWRRTSGDSIVVVEGSIETEFAVFGGNRAFVAYENEPVAYDRTLSGRFEDDGRTVWMSFLIDFSEITKISTEGHITLMDGEEEVISFGRTSGFNRIGFTWDPEVFEFITNTNSDGENWVVVRIDMSGDANAENIYMWVNPLPQFEPRVIDAQTASTEESDQRLAINNGFDGIRIKTAGGTPFEMSVDEIRLGYSYSDVSKIEEVIPENTLARDQFQYPVGDQLIGQGATGSQWAGPWQNGFGATGEAVVIEGSLSNGSRLQTDGNHILLNHITDAQVRADRDLAEFIEDDGNEYWVSFLARFESAGLSNVVYLSFVNNRDFDGQAVQRVGFGKVFAEANVGMFDRDGPNVTGTLPIEGGVKWYLGRIQFSGDEEPDVVSLWVDHNPEEQPDLNNPYLQIETTALNQGFQTLQFRAESAGPIIETLFFADELRFGTTYESVAQLDDQGGGGPVTGLEDLLDNTFGLYNYPNPFSVSTTIQYELERQSSYVKLSVMSLQGREVAILFEGEQQWGSHTVSWDGSTGAGNLQSGVYLYRLESNGKSVTKRMIYLMD